LLCMHFQLDDARILQGTPVPCCGQCDSWHGRSARYPQNGWLAASHAMDVSDIFDRNGRDHRYSTFRGILQQGRRPMGRLELSELWEAAVGRRCCRCSIYVVLYVPAADPDVLWKAAVFRTRSRSEERRVGKEYSTQLTRWY